MSRPRNLTGLGNRYQVKLWVPPKQMQEIADERTEGMVSYYVEAARGMDFIRQLNALDVLARSCYLQGVNDVLDAVASGSGQP
jgi:hypothetical protein